MAARWIAEALGSLVQDTKDYIVASVWATDAREPDDDDASDVPVNLVNTLEPGIDYSPILETLAQATLPVESPCASHKDLLQTISLTVTSPLPLPLADSSLPPSYTIHVFNRITNARANVAKTDEEFEKLRLDVCAALAYGHVCDGVCPWFFFDLQSKTPSQPMLESWGFHSRYHPAVLAAKVETHEGLLHDLMQFVRWRHRQTCTHATESVPRLVVDFILRDVDNPKLYVHRPAKGGSTTNALVTVPPCIVTCALCTQAKEVADYGVTCLPCGHVFHDECIVEALNQQLSCPTCRATGVVTPPPVSRHGVAPSAA
ncbi:hypothetical protein H310_04924 [Aphanomyces invadans]|uniref:RING-type domain-containing protein n=1 Tax=Aphanomyces invadans TaxID=157072 RepID=A0A024UBB3_9STRA|nr:hypothetical protein H310_04924 [Aphanomyces invadans]ETW03470.1 hypothetical protein H310_04924 [Aphanomyces invadans]|eukprot:XP_008867699.1 hypothetical protein H310_04924 [Aphanomyces invadans]